jgi:hypothetical protein
LGKELDGPASPEGADAPPQVAAALPPPAFSRVFANLVFLVVLGVGISGWILIYTDWFPIVGGLLGLGGLFAWIAFVSGLLTKARKEQLQEQFDTSFLRSRRTLLVLIVIPLLFALWASRHGTIIVQSLGDDHDRTLTITRDASPEKTAFQQLPLHLSPRSVRKILVATGWTGSTYRVKLSGLPAIRLEVPPLRQRLVASPASFLAHPALLVRPTERVSTNMETMPMRLEITRGGKTWSIPKEKYRGETVWVGCDADVVIPDRLINRWRLEPGAEQNMPRWTTPLSLSEIVELEKGDRVQIALRRDEDNGIYASAEAVVDAYVPERGFAQEVRLDHRAPTPSSTPVPTPKP